MKQSFFVLIFFLVTVFCINNVTGKNYSVNQLGTSLYQIENMVNQGKHLSCDENKLILTDNLESSIMWRKTNLEGGWFYLDLNDFPSSSCRLRATSYLGTNLTTSGLEGRNDDVQWKIISADEPGWVLLEHKSSGKFLFFDGKEVRLTGQPLAETGAKWKLSLKKIDLKSIESPIIMMGDDQAGFRDPAVIYDNGIFYMYYSYVTTEENEKIYWYVAMSKSEDLIHWTEPKIITEKDQSKNFSSPGGITRFNGQWILCMQTYVMPGYTRKDPIRYGNQDCRLWIMRSNDLENWSEPEKLYVRGPSIEPEGMIDAFIVEDKDEKGKWWCFFKPKTGGTGYSWSYDLKTWFFRGYTDKSGENVCVWVENGAYLMMHSPKDGVGILKSTDLKEWTEFSKPDTLGKEDWPWASMRVTAGFVMDLRKEPAIGKYILFFHGQGPPPQSTEIINSGTDLGIAWSDDLLHWEWPAK